MIKFIYTYIEYR